MKDCCGERLRRQGLVRWHGAIDREEKVHCRTGVPYLGIGAVVPAASA